MEKFFSVYMNTEQRLLLCCGSVFLGTCSHGELEKSLSKPMDWERFIDYAVMHRMLYFVSRALENYVGDFVPDEIYSRIQNLCVENTTRSLILSAALIRLLRLFEKNQIQALPFKGPVLSRMIYGTEDARNFTDLDILVSKENAVRARELLLLNGFSTDLSISESQLKFYLEKENYFQFFNEAGTVNIDLHWELTGRYAQHSVCLEEIMPHGRSITFCSQSIPAMGYEDTLIYLCVHGSRNCWEKLEMLFSVAAMIRFHSSFFVWENVLEKAEVMGVKKMVLVALLLVKDTFHISLPELAAGEVKKFRVESLLPYILPRIYSHEDEKRKTKAWRFSPFHFRVRDRFSHSIVHAVRLLFQPTIIDWQIQSLPDRFLPLYHILRPCRLVREGLVSLAGHLRRSRGLHR